jgi:hypothetical protein
MLVVAVFFMNYRLYYAVTFNCNKIYVLVVKKYKIPPTHHQLIYIILTITKITVKII